MQAAREWGMEEDYVKEIFAFFKGKGEGKNRKGKGKGKSKERDLR